MAKSIAKRVTKQAVQPTTKISSSKTRDIPAPYSKPPPVLEPFIETLDPSHVYIVHIDNHPRDLKMRVFGVPIVMNIVITGLLLWRLKVALPYYFAILLSTLGYNNETRVEIGQTGYISLFDIAMGRAFTFFIDFALYTFIVPWPKDFFFGSPASPISWRRFVGFQNQEIVVRRSRKWDENLPKDWLEEDTDSIVYQERIMPAIDREWVKAKTSYMMMDKSWDLDFAGMITAHKLMNVGKAGLDDFQKTVILRTKDHGWLVWSVWKLDEGAQTVGREKLVMFKDKLTAMGKENLFFKWVELIQFESSHPGGFTPERQTSAMKQAQGLFEAQGVDFDQFWKEVGGVEGLPGMETTG